MSRNVWANRPLLDIASYARRGPGERIHLSKKELEIIQRTVTRTPEVMVKVLTHGGQNLKAVQRHLNYLSRKGEERIETDDGQSIQGKEAEATLLKEWDLDLEEHRRQMNLNPTNRRTQPKLVHKVLFSMPPGTPSEKVLIATQNFAREQFGLKHRYAMVLHTDEPHPHVHLVLKTLSEEGVRLNIKKATLREWRSEFARHLRELGVPANATERLVRGQRRRSPSNGRYRTQERGTSTYAFVRPADPVAKSGTIAHIEVAKGWGALVRRLSAQGHHDLAQRSDQFSKYLRELTDRHELPPPTR